MAGAARGKNPLEQAVLLGSKAWATSTAYTAGQIVSSNGYVWQAQSSATSGATAPSGYGTTASDGTITWTKLGLQMAPVVSALYTTHNSSYSTQYGITNTAETLIPNSADLPFRFTGGVPTSSVFGNDYMAICANWAPVNGNIYSTYSGSMNVVTFVFEGTIFEAKYFDGNSNPFSIIVDGQYLDNRFGGTNTGGVRYFTVDFTNVAQVTGPVSATGRQGHTITFEFGDVPFDGINCLSTDTISLPKLSDDFSCVLIGDSQAVATNNPYYGDAFGIQIQKLMGLPDMMLCGIGGTGMVNPGSTSNYIGHCIADLQNLNSYRPLGLIIVQPSQNDANYTSQLPAASLTLLQALRAAFPTVAIWVLGNITGGAISLATAQTNEAIIATSVAARQAAGDDLIFMTSAANDPNGPWITGTGYVGTTNGSGSSDVDISNDGAHMTPAGHAIYARKSMNAFLSAIANIP